jgi:hypothetical protein
MTHCKLPITRASARLAAIMLLMSVMLDLSPSFAAEQSAQLGNWFDDPFVVVRKAVPDCPEPLGPRITRQDATLQEHYRAERGTSCYLAGECSKPNAYLYDAPISAAIQKLFEGDPSLARNSSLWITVQRRFVYLEGCRGTSTDIDHAEALIRALPDVQLVLVNVAADPYGHLPYKRLSTPVE